MKKLLVMSLAVMVAISSCQDEGTDQMEGLSDSETVASLDLSSETAVESGFEDVDLVAESGMEFLEMGLNAGGRFGSGLRKGKDAILECASVERDTANQTLTIDFGDGCEGPNGVVRKGKVIITWMGALNEVGHKRVVTLEDFGVDSLSLEGTRTVELVALDSSSRTVEVTLTGGKVTFPDSTFATREASHTRIHFRGETYQDDYATRSGSANGLKRDGSEYSVTILEDLVYKRGCFATKTVIAVEGIKEIVSGENTATIDYGDGTCDNEVVITLNGVSVTKTIYPKGRLRRR